MKSFLILMLAVLAEGACAQKIELGLYGGTAKPFYKKSPDALLTPMAGLRVQVNKQHIQLGAGLEASGFKVKTTELAANYLTGRLEEKPATLYFASPYYSLNVYLNGKANMPKGYLYYGITGGYAMGQEGSKSYRWDPLSGDLVQRTEKTAIFGFCLGSQLGYAFFPFKHIGFNAEIGIRYSSFSNAQHLFFVPVTAGVRYRL